MIPGENRMNEEMKEIIEGLGIETSPQISEIFHRIHTTVHLLDVRHLVLTIVRDLQVGLVQEFSKKKVMFLYEYDLCYMYIVNEKSHVSD